MTKRKFKDWFINNLKVSRYPLPAEIRSSRPDVVINVSDEHIEVNQNVCMELGVRYYWFPITETGSNMGLNSIYAALQILWISEVNNRNVLLHCHAGANRSVTVAQSYYYMRTKTHLVEKDSDLFSMDDYARMFNLDTPEALEDFKKVLKRNRVQNNQDSGHLPAKFNYESFLKHCELEFSSYQVASGGKLDSLKLMTNNNYY